jgi:hypothetical protein
MRHAREVFQVYEFPRNFVRNINENQARFYIQITHLLR